MTTKTLRWLRWAWRVAFASYLGGAVTLLPGSSLIVFWSAILFMPLVIATVGLTRSKSLAAACGIVVGAALLSCAQLVLALNRKGQVPQDLQSQGLWLIGVFGPFVLYFVVSRYLKAESLRLAGASDLRGRE